MQTIDLKFLMQPVYPLIELFTGKWGRFKRLGQYMRGTIKTIVDRERKELALEKQHPADPAAAAAKPFNFVRQLIAASYPDGSPLTEADIIDNVLQTILAAKDTTAIVSPLVAGFCCRQ
jgi:cytochrome P450